MTSERWLGDPLAGHWIDFKWTQPFPEKVADLVPRTFDAFARVLHPLRYQGRDMRWKYVAARNQRELHPGVRIEEILVPTGHEPDISSVLKGQFVGVLPRQKWNRLCDVLRAHTSGNTLIVGYWEGLIDPPPIAVRTLDLPNRRYYLAELSFEALEQSAILDGPTSPNLVWPSDRSWFFNTDIDEASTHVGASVPAVSDILNCPDLEALAAHPDDPV